MAIRPIDQKLIEKCGRWVMDKALQKQWLAEIEDLLKDGANPNVEPRPDQPGLTLLFHPVRQGPAALVELLVKYGADPNAPQAIFSRESEARTFPLHLAAEAGKPAKVRALILAGAKLDVRDYEKRLPAEAAKKSDIKALFRLAEAGELKADTKVEAPKRSPPPQRLTEFFINEAPGYEGHAIPDFIAKGAATKVKFLKKPSTALFTKNEVDPLTCPDYHPLATLIGEDHFLVVDGKRPACPVLRWDQEDADFYPIDDSLDAFVKRLVPAGKKKK